MQENHPEIRPGEVWLSNIIEDEYHNISYKTKRMGEVAYALSGYVIEGIYPVFVSKDEYGSRMRAIDKRRHDDRFRHHPN